MLKNTTSHKVLGVLIIDEGIDGNFYFTRCESLDYRNWKRLGYPIFETFDARVKVCVNFIGVERLSHFELFDAYLYSRKFGNIKKYDL